MMKKRLKILVLAMFTFGYLGFQMVPLKTQAQTKRATSIEEKITEARTVSEGLFQRVKGLLLEKIKDGNFAEAAEVCSNVAQQMTKDYAAEKGIDVHRVSLKLRNPLNRPDKFEKKRLRIFEKEIAENKTASEYYEVIEKDDERILRYMKPIIIQEMCLKCHGSESQIPADVMRILANKYPKDRATGYKIGDVRGAISVSISLEK